MFLNVTTSLPAKTLINKTSRKFITKLESVEVIHLVSSAIYTSVWHTSQKMSTIWVTFEFGTMTSGHTLRARIAMAKFFSFQAQAIAGFSSCGEAACYPEILRISYNFCTRQHLYWANYLVIWLMLCKQRKIQVKPIKRLLFCWTGRWPRPIAETWRPPQNSWDFCN